MRKADEILKDLKEAQYQVYNKQEETEEGLTPENRRNYSSEELRNIFIGTIYGETNQNTINFLRDAINKMSDEWVAEFLKVVNGNTVEKVSESVNEEETWKDYFGKTIKTGDTVVRFKSGQFYLYKGKVLGLATTPANAKHGYIRIELDESPEHVLYKEEAGKIIVCDPKNTLLYN